MKLLTIITATLLTTTSLVASVKAQEEPATTQTQPTRAEIASACIQNRAETLPIPFSDVSPKDWAFKAVMTMYYCGAFRQAAPPSLFKQAVPTQN